MLNKPLYQVTFSDLQAMLGSVRESKTLEFKREIPETKKFLATVSALANTAGGDLVIGIEADQGLAKSIPGIAIPDVDQEKLRLEQLLADNLEPRLPHVDIEVIECGNGHQVLILRARKSWAAPHRVLTNGKFYGRNSGGNYELDTDQLRNAFVLSETAVERIRRFREERLKKISAGKTPIGLATRPALVVHAIPFSTFATGQTLDIVQAIANGHVMPLAPGRIGKPNNTAPNIDGLVTYSNESPSSIDGYAQAFRSGAIEGVDVLMQDEGARAYLPYGFENDVVSAVKLYLNFMKDHDLGYPVFIGLSLWGANRCCFRIPTDVGIGYYERGPLREDIVSLSEISIENEDADVAKALRPAFNTIWNAFGLAQSDKYDGQGNWIGSA